MSTFSKKIEELIRDNLKMGKYKETIDLVNAINNPPPPASPPTGFDLFKAEVSRKLTGGDPPDLGKYDPNGHYAGYAVSDVLLALPTSKRQEALLELRKMAVQGFPALGGGGVLGQPPYGGPAGPSNPTNPLYDHERMLCMRMRWRNVHNSPFENVCVYAAVGRKVFITIITKDMKAVTLDVDDDGLYPSDHLIAEIRTLGG